MDDIVERLRGARGANRHLVLLAADEIERLRKATGGLAPKVVAYGMRVAAEARLIDLYHDLGLTMGEAQILQVALCSATFEYD